MEYSMSFYNAILNSVILPLGDLSTGGSYIRNLNQWRAYDSYSDRDLRRVQKDNLKSILKYASKHVPYYQKINYRKDLSSEGNLKRFPILTKDILRNQVDSLISNHHKKSSLDINHSSGSTGVQSFTYMTMKHKFYLRALQTHWWMWSGYHIGDKVLQFGISQKRGVLKNLKDLFYRSYYHKAFGISEKEFADLARKVKEKSIGFIAGYPSVINQLALVSEPNTKIEGIICFGDKLFNQHRINIRHAFGEYVRVLDTYGCAEGLLMACRKDLDYYYIMSPHVYLEIVDDDGQPVPDGEMGNILVTCLTNKAMPLIRYRLGDLGIMLPEELYPEQRELEYPLLQKIVGRETDVIKTESGKILNVHSFTGVFEYFQEIKQFKIIQRDLKSIKVEYIVDDTITDERLKELEKKFLNLTDSDLTITFVKVSRISATKSGKPQIIDATLE
ncbi:MAG: phenylacetate--CoA ligase family protein [Flavobacteriaceae bacterium]|nr:phenylacetate--CoA ligase family protein [Flavobacteriaceae bacterium]